MKDSSNIKEQEREQTFIDLTQGETDGQDGSSDPNVNPDTLNEPGLSAADASGSSPVGVPSSANVPETRGWLTSPTAKLKQIMSTKSLLDKGSAGSKSGDINQPMLQGKPRSSSSGHAEGKQRHKQSKAANTGGGQWREPVEPLARAAALARRTTRSALRQLGLVSHGLCAACAQHLSA